VAPERLVLAHGCAPGDVVVMTAAVRDLARAYPGQYQVAVETHSRTLWQHNPHVRTPAQGFERRGARLLKLGYGPYIRETRTRPLHFVEAFHRDLARQLGRPVPLTEPRPDLHLGPDDGPLVAGRYWLVLAGGKLDFTTKQWPFGRYQALADLLGGLGLAVVQAGALDRGPPAHRHPELTGVLNLVGRTNLRELMRLVKYADGVIAGITMAMHLAAAFERPCVVFGGAREEWWWEAYSRDNEALGDAAARVAVSHRYLHTFGMMPPVCGDDAKTWGGVKGCWLNKADRAEPDAKKSYCRFPEPAAGGPRQAARCQNLISVEKAFEAVLSYYLDGTLSPPEGAMIPNVNARTVVTLPDGRRATITVAAEGLEATAAPDVLVAAPALRPPALAEAPRGNRVEAAPAAPSKHAKRAARHGAIQGGAPAVGPAPYTAPYVPPPAPAPPPKARSVLDDPAIGGALTAFVLCYGDYHDLHRRCLDLLLATTPRDRVEVRVGGNALGARSRAYLDALHAEGQVAALYLHEENLRKYPVQREMWHDPARPIRTRWAFWLDDDSLCDKGPAWLVDLAHALIRHSRAGMVGPKKYVSVSAAQAAWMKRQPWWRGRPLQDAQGREAPNGNKVHFAVGAAFAVRTEALRAADLPAWGPHNAADWPGHNGGDWTNGAALWQAGLETANWCLKKEVLTWSSVPRRGLSERHPGLAG
jgi:hypothetical protein